MTSKRFPASVPRKMYWSHEVGGCERCPDCDGELAPEFHAYMVGTRQDGEIESFITGTDDGYYCASCPVVVLDFDRFRRLLEAGTDAEPGSEFVVLGLVDREAIPEHKRHLPFGDDNPIPLVQFTNHSTEMRRPSSGTNRPRIRKRKSAAARKLGSSGRRGQKRRRKRR